MGKPKHSIRPPSEATAFVALDGAPGATPILAARPASMPTRQQASGRKTLHRADGRELRKQTVYLEASLARRLAVYCAEHGRDLSGVVSKALEEHFAKSGSGSF